MRQKKGSLLTTSLLLAVCSYQFLSLSTHSKVNNKLNVVKPHVKRFTGKQVVVAVIDTGIDQDLLSGNSYCKEGHKDFSGEGINDTHGHGTHVSTTIDQYAKNYVFADHYKSTGLLSDNGLHNINKIKVNYCQIILKFYREDATGMENLSHTLEALRWAIDHKVDIINYSGGGVARNDDEEKLILEALDKGIKVVAAAGNEGDNIDFIPYYPASYDKRIYSVGNWTRARVPASSSNYGDYVHYWEVGMNVLSRLPNGKFGYMSGTSQATAIKSGKLVRKMMTYK